MAFKYYDKPYINPIKIDEKKQNEIIIKSENMDIQEILQYSLINKIPLAIVFDNYGNNLIHLTILNPIKNKSEFNKLNFIEFLVQNNVNPDQPNKENQTPLHLACQYQYLTIINYLLNINVNPNYQDNNGFNSLNYLLSGNIKIYEDFEIKEFILPNKRKKDEIVNKDILFDLKKKLWDLLNKDYNYFFESLNKTINSNIYNNKDYKKKLNNFTFELSKISNNSNYNLINEKNKNFKNDLMELIDKKWNKFPNDENIILHNIDESTYSLNINNSSMGIIKNADVKLEIKNKIKETVNIIRELIKNYNFKNDTSNYLINNLNETFTDILKNLVININSTPNPAHFPTNNYNFNSIYVLNVNNILGEDKYNNYSVNNIYNNKNKHYDFADNIIVDNFFFGGSRLIDVDYNNYENIKIILESLSFNKKFIFILLLFFQNMVGNSVKDNILNEINNLDDDNNNYRNIFNNLINIINLPGYNLLYLYFEDIFRTVFFDKIIYDINNFYSSYCANITKFNNTKLDGTIHLYIFRLGKTLMLMNNTFNYDITFNQVIKIDNFVTCIKYYDTTLKSLAVWTGYLLDTKNNFLPFKNIEYYLDRNNHNIDDKIIDIMINIINNNININDIEDYYRNLNISIPEIYIEDLIFYLLNITKFEEIKNSLNFDNIIINPNSLITDLINNTYNFIDNQRNNQIFNIIINQLPPSLANYYLIFFDEYDITNSINFNVRTYLIIKFIESYNLGLNYCGCLPVLIKPNNNNIFTINFKIGQNLSNFVFNPEFNAPFEITNFNQNPNNFNILNFFNYQTPLPFLYYFDNIGRPNNSEYFQYINGRYRPPYIKSFTLHLLNIINKFNKLLQLLFKNNYLNILDSLLNYKQKISLIYDKLFVLSKLIIEKQKIFINILSVLKKKNKINENIIDQFNFYELTKQLNNINAYIFLYYYLYKNDKIMSLPEFIFYKLDSDKYKLYNKINSTNFVNDELVGGNNKNINIKQYSFGNQEILDEEFIFNKNMELPPSLNDNLYLFYELNKKKIIVEILKNLSNNEILNLIEDMYKSRVTLNEVDKYNFIYLNIAKLIEEIIKDYAKYSVKLAIDNIDNNNINSINNTFEIKTVLKNTIDTINFAYNKITNQNINILNNLYNISDNNINTNNQSFIIYPSEYTNTSLLVQKYYIDINKNILDLLLNKGALPLLDNENKSCIYNCLKTFNYKIIKNIINNNIYFNEYDFIKNELLNHQNKILYNMSYKESLNNFIKPQFEDIKLLILSDESIGNNILFNLKNSFIICFYIMNEYLTDNLWNFNNDYNANNFKLIINSLDDKIFNKNNINENYLYKIILNNIDKIPNNDTILIKRNFIEIFKNKKNELNKNIISLNKEKDNLIELELSFDHINTDINIINKQIIELENKIKIFENITNDNYIDPNIGKKDNIINTYNKLTVNGYGVYLKMWDLLLNDENLLENSFNLSLIKILIKQNEIILNKKENTFDLIYFNHIEKVAFEYFNKPKYIDQKINKSLTFIYNLLIHLTKITICFGIEIITRKVVFNHLILIYSNFSVDDINSIISRLYNTNLRLDDNSTFLDILYNELPEKFVKNSINLFENVEEKINFESESINEILQNLFNLLINAKEIINFDDIIINNLNKNIINYFDLFTTRIINNWYVICENSFKYIINHQRITNTYQIINFS